MHFTTPFSFPKIQFPKDTAIFFTYLEGHFRDQRLVPTSLLQEPLRRASMAALVPLKLQGTKGREDYLDFVVFLTVEAGKNTYSW